ncbi:Transposase IS4 [Popillia japonica]|uniref:Transposase IS4 n=1 Tax=Popillia japonica TaxID=7064 RepID=A0AAW1L9D6_POPJA
MYNWRDRQPLNDDELLAAAEEAAIELINQPLDNETITDEEQSEDEYFETSNMTTVLHAQNLGNKNANYEMEANIEIENNTPTAASEFSESKKSKKGRKAEEELKRKWKKKEITTNIPSYSLDENPIAEHFQHCSTYTDYFVTVLGSNTVKDIVYQSNLYAIQRGKTMNFKECELLTFLGLNFFMGYHTLPSYTHYWSCAEYLGIATVKRIMPRSRFEQFLKYLHINDNSTIPPDNKDKIYKIRPFVTTLNKRFDILNNGTRKLSVDESMIIFKGRSTLKQYNPKKTIKRGYRLWCLGDQNGYIKKFDVYQGKNEVAEH